MATTNVRTVKSAGGDYSSLSAWEAGRQGDLVNDDRIEIADCYAFEDTTRVTVDGSTTDVNRYLEMRGVASEKVAGETGKWSTNRYRLKPGESTTIPPLIIQDQDVRITDLQIYADWGNTQGNAGAILLRNGAMRILVSGCILTGDYATTGASYNDGIQIYSTANAAGSYLKVWNTIFYGFTNGTSAAVFSWDSNWTTTIYSCTAGRCYAGFARSAGTFVAKNCYAQGSSVAYSGTITKTTCASADTSGSAGLQNIAFDDDNFIDTGAGTEDLHLTPDSELIDVGTDTSGESAPFDFTTDIDGDTIVNWSIGADDGPSATAYTLSCEGGAVEVTGGAAGLLRDASLACEAGAIEVAGQDAGTICGRRMSAEAGAVEITGTGASLLRTALLAAESGAVEVAGTGASLLRDAVLPAESGTVEVEGTAASLLRAARLDAASGAVEVTGQDAALLCARVLGAEAGAVIVTGEAASLLVDRILSAEAGAVIVTGAEAALVYQPGTGAYLLNCEGGAVVVTGQTASLIKMHLLAAEGGAVVVTGGEADLLADRLLDAEGGAVAITGAAAALLRDARLVAGPGQVVVTGMAATLLRDARLDAEGGAVAVSGQAVTLTYSGAGQYRLDCESGSIIISGQDLSFWIGVLHPAQVIVKSRADSVEAPESRSKVQAKPPVRKVEVNRRRAWN